MHKPVLLHEMISALAPRDGGIYVDATFGGGGYSRGILASSQSSKVYAIDCDKVANCFFQELSAEFPERVYLTISRFSKLKEVLHLAGLEKVDGVVFDLGVSSMQLNAPERGFSFMRNGPLDMRMCSISTKNASVFVNTMPEEIIADVIYYYGGERCSRRVARAIIEARQKRKIESTDELAKIVRSVVPRSRVNPIDPATRTFQAIRIWVNDELKELQEGLDAAASVLALGGRIVATSFHSLEDRIVKRTFAALCENGFRLLNKKTIKPTEDEVKNNPRSRSAKLRAIVKEG